LCPRLLFSGEDTKEQNKVLRHAVFSNSRRIRAPRIIKNVVAAFGALPKKSIRFKDYQAGKNISPSVRRWLYALFLVTFKMKRAGRSICRIQLTRRLAKRWAAFRQSVLIVDLLGEAGESSQRGEY